MAMFGSPSGPETVLRKYPNRRIYDPTRNDHVTLNDIADRIKAGERIRIVDHQTGEDLTQSIMGQVLFETLKTRPDYLPLDLLILMIRAQDGLVRDFLYHGMPQAFQLYLENQRRMMAGMGWGAPGFGNFGAGGFFPGFFPSGAPTPPAPPAAGGAPVPPAAPGGAPPAGAGSAAGPAPAAGGADHQRLMDEIARLRSEVQGLKDENRSKSKIVTRGRKKNRD